jgi:ribosome biogenesis protein UTP30
LKASKALLKHIEAPSKVKTDSKPNLLADGEGELDESEVIWLTLTTKKFITDTKRLKPGKISVPHPLNSSSTSTICLIVSDPQRTYKDIVASPAFPPALGARITKVVAISKIKAKWTQYEAQRKLYSEHDIFLADDRIITFLPKLLGKTFYHNNTKRPIPINIAPLAPRTDGKRAARAQGAKSEAAEPKKIAAEIEKAIQGTLVHLAPSTNTSVKVGYASWDASEIAENTKAVADALIEKWVPKKWRGVKSIFIKGRETAALPIWLADELWVDENTIKQLEESNTGRKRKRIEDAATKKKKAIEEAGNGEKKEKKAKLVESNDDKLDKDIALRKENLKKQKAAAALDVEDGVLPMPAKKEKRQQKAKVSV